MTAEEAESAGLRIAPAEPINVEAMALLLEEMDRFYGVTEFDPISQRAGQIAEALFANPPVAYALLAWEAGHPVGLASYSFLWPAVGLTRSLYLKELYVARSHRRMGVGRLLMQRIFAVAVRERCSRVEWATDDNNQAAQDFYAKLGFSIFPSKVDYRMEGEVPIGSHASGETLS